MIHDGDTPAETVAGSVRHPGAIAVQHQIRITVTGDRATVTIAGNGPLPTGRYMGAVVKLTGNRSEQVT